MDRRDHLAPIPEFEQRETINATSAGAAAVRTESEFRELFSAAGLGLTRVLPPEAALTPSVLSIVEGRAA